MDRTALNTSVECWITSTLAGLQTVAKQCFTMRFQILSDCLGEAEVLDLHDIRTTAFKVKDPDGITLTLPVQVISVFRSWELN